MHDIFIVDHCNNYQNLIEIYPHAKVVKPNSNTVELFRHIAAQSVTKHAWILSDRCNYENFDFEYIPAWHQDDQLHVWPSAAQQRGGYTCLINSAKFIDKSNDLVEIQNYQNVCWHTEPVKLLDAPNIIIWNIPGFEENLQKLQQRFAHAKTLRYVGSMLDMVKKSLRHADHNEFWILSSSCDYTDFDSLWLPDWENSNSIHCWATTGQKFGDTFFIPNSIDVDTLETIDELDYYPSIIWHSNGYTKIKNPDIVIWNTSESDATLAELQQQYPNAKTLRYVGNHLDMIKKSLRYVNSKNFWVLSSNCDYADFDPAWQPNWESRNKLHCWATSEQKFGDTFYVPKADFELESANLEQLDYYPGIIWHNNSYAKIKNPDIVIWDLGGHASNIAQLQQQYPNAKTLRYIGSHLDMIKKSLRYVDSKNFWVLSSCCDYSSFDPAWQPSWASCRQLHCWASGNQKFGDTFYVSKADFEFESADIQQLDYYPGIIWHESGYSRFPWPINYSTDQDLFTTLKNHKFTSIYEYFVMPGSIIGSTVDPCLWKKRHLIAYNRNGHVSLCPRDCISEISSKVNDYPYIQYHKCKNSTQKPQDIVFISYDEKNADLNYENLKKRFPAALRVHGVQGNVAAYKAAAKLSTTPWYYAVFPKTEIDPIFDFDYHPDYLEQPGHYIFYAHNCITDYSYGHGGVKMYHVKTTVEIENWGYDFTMSSPVTTIPVNSCYNNPATPFESWRTSFREVLKLRESNTVESKYRLHRWLSVGQGEFGKYSLAGADAAMKYNGDLHVANSWEWLRDYFDSVVD